MLVVGITMIAILVICAGVGLYVAYPHRGQAVPAAPWLGEAMQRAADAVPTLDAEDDRTYAVSGGHRASDTTPER